MRLPAAMAATICGGAPAGATARPSALTEAAGPAGATGAGGAAPPVWAARAEPDPAHPRANRTRAMGRTRTPHASRLSLHAPGPVRPLHGLAAANLYAVTASSVFSRWRSGETRTTFHARPVRSSPEMMSAEG